MFCVRFELIFIFSIIRHGLGHDRPVSITNYGKKTVKRMEKANYIIKMKRNRSQNTTNALLAEMESSYVTTCFGLILWPSSGYNLVALRVYTICLEVG